jgi:hypothetical protein
MQTWCTEKSLAWLHEEGLQLKLCHMLCFSEIMKLRFQLCELIGQTFCPIWCPKMLRLDTTALRAGASVCRVWYSGLMTQTAWQYKFQHNRMFHTFVYVDCWCEIWRPCSIALEDIHSSSWRQVDIWDGHWVPCSKSAFSNQGGRFDLVMKIEAFWDVMLCVWVHSSDILKNHYAWHMRNCSPNDDTATCSRKLESSETSLWELQVSCGLILYENLFQNKNSDFCAPLTSFDWNEVDPNLIGTSSIDTTCTIWGLETGQVCFTCFSSCAPESVCLCHCLFPD